MKNEEMKNIYSVYCNYDGHIINNMLKNSNKINFNRQLLRKGEVFSVEKERYFQTLNFVTSELLRRNPTEITTWHDCTNKERPYDKFCFNVIKVRKELIDEPLFSMIKDNLVNVFNERGAISTGKAPINIEATADGYIYVEGKIYYDDLPTFWHDLRHGGLNKVFSERQKYCAETIKNNKNCFIDCVEKIYFNDIDGYYDNTLDKFESIFTSEQQLKNMELLKMLKLD